MCVKYVLVLEGPGEDIGFPGAGVTGSGEQLDVDAEDRILAVSRAVSTCNF